MLKPSFSEVQKWALDNWQQWLTDDEAYAAYAEAHKRLLDKNPFDECVANPPPTWTCPKCGGEAGLSYYLCDVEPYPFKDVLKECTCCAHMWEDSTPPNAEIRG